MSEHRLTRPHWVFWLTALTAFFAACLNYAVRLNLWGDEAFSLISAQRGWGHAPLDVHMPTYYWLLATVIGGIGDSRELLLRMIHVVPFAVGLGFGFLTVQRTFLDRRLTILVAVLAIILPNYIFYATNLRMYSLVFMTSMAFIDAVSRLLSSEPEAPMGMLIWLAISGVALVCSDYSAVVYYVAGFVMVGLYSFTRKNFRPLWAVAVPGLVFGIIVILTFANILVIKNWDGLGYQSPTWTGFTELAKGLYLSCRPALDLIYQAHLPLPLALGFPLILMGLLCLTSWQFFRCTEKIISPQFWTLTIALLWVPLIPTGYSFTRLFLPSQLFMLAILAWWSLTAKTWLKYIGLTSLGLLLVLNLSQAISPILKPYNLVPFKAIAIELIDYGKEHDISQIVLSNNSLNTLSIEHYIRKLSGSNQFQIERVDNAGLIKILSQNQDASILFVSHMGENGRFVDVTTLPVRNRELLNSYVSLAELPYNWLWLKRYSDGAGQSSIIQTYEMK